MLEVYAFRADPGASAPAAGGGHDGFVPGERGQAAGTMHAETAKTVEFKFPDGDFEIDTTARVPGFGDLLTKRGRVWRVDDVLPGSPPLVMLEPASPAHLPRP